MKQIKVSSLFCIFSGIIIVFLLLFVFKRTRNNEGLTTRACEKTKYGCCPDGHLIKREESGESCKNPGCPPGTTIKYLDDGTGFYCDGPDALVNTWANSVKIKPPAGRGPPKNCPAPPPCPACEECTETPFDCEKVEK
jgi:hypothetical protein